MESSSTSGEILAALRPLLADLSSRPERDIHPETPLEAGLGLDSLAMIHLAVSIEERFHVVVPPYASASEMGIVTVADLARYVEDLLPLRRAS
jgi:acyl carrier protein